MRVIVHGGAGSPADEPTPRQEVLDDAAETGTAADDPTDAVVAAVRVLESDPRFNAGVGSAVQSDGYIRTDAGLMTDDRETGAACGMPGVEAAVEVARLVKEETPHVLVSGVHAVDLADAFGVETDANLWSERTREQWEDLDERPAGDAREHAEWVAERFGGDPEGRSETPADHDTVGAVATDGEAVAAATSTGGRWLALAGRVGDVPQVGSGFYCTDAGGVSATGTGEDIARLNLSRRASQFLEDGLDAQAAADAALAEFGDLAAGSAGLIVLTPDGDFGEAYNSEAMQTAIAGSF
ncbi:isoaspartyl peptidase/L-asparaginase [Natronomonas gomsonensis]|uniref:isoaspartyl peptidase/L-asparaginase n=1 Tax=Natronomonas gomsonensis TaxID=1046043 RepID=UPI0015B8B989|nr:isoaspartyl peptidase/L-asparaginase [Natronomonas gomsonensis]